MANEFYLRLLFILIIQGSTFIVAQLIQYQSTDGSNSRSIQSLTTTTTTTKSTMSYDEHDESFYGHDTNGADLYDEEGEDSSDMNSSPITNAHNMTAHLSHETPIDAYEDEVSPYHEEEDEEDDDDEHEHNDDETLNAAIHGDTRSSDRLGLNSPTINLNPSKPGTFQTTSRMSIVPTDLWTDIFSRPAILVGIIGAIIIAMLSAILLVMFIIYRMRKKDEGSYVLEEAPRKSPSHAYTRVSSREFFA